MIKNFSHISLDRLACTPSTCQGGIMKKKKKNNDKIPKQL